MPEQKQYTARDLLKLEAVGSILTSSVHAVNLEVLNRIVDQTDSDAVQLIQHAMRTADVQRELQALIRKLSKKYDV